TKPAFLFRSTPVNERRFAPGGRAEVDVAGRGTANPVEAAAALGPLIRAHVLETEAGRRLAQPVVEAMLEAGIFGLNRPVAFGGAELDPVTTFRVVEELARHD